MTELIPLARPQIWFAHKRVCGVNTTSSNRVQHSAFPYLCAEEASFAKRIKDYIPSEYNGGKTLRERLQFTKSEGTVVDPDVSPPLWSN
jgi:hypothetical protein